MARLYRPESKAGTDDLDVLHPNRSVSVAGSVWTVREYSMREGAMLADVAHRAAQKLTNGTHCNPELYHCLAVATGHERVHVSGLTAPDLDKLIAAWRELNADWIEQRPQPAPGPPKKNAVRWSTVYATLIANGHSREDIGSYTLRQIRLFYDEVMRLERRSRARRIVDTSHGFAGGDDANRLIRQLEKD